MQFNVDDIVVATKDYDRRECGSLIGQIGRIVFAKANVVGVEFKEPIARGHDCDRNGKRGHCWYMPKDYVMHADDETIKQALAEERARNVVKVYTFGEE